jgi:glycosyltransferase involved in cell wall biosynthesis
MLQHESGSSNERSKTCAKKTLFFIQPTFHRPSLPNFADRFKLLSEACQGMVVCASEPGHDGLQFGNFQYHALPLRSSGFANLLDVPTLVRLALKLHRKNHLDFVHSYDPFLYGATALAIGAFTGAKVIIEINGDLLGSEFDAKRGRLGAAKRAAKALLIRSTLKRAYAVKFLNQRQAANWKRFCGDAKIEVFHDFVPTHVFDPSKARDQNFILCVGFPFYIKGVDILIKAFRKVCDRHPHMKLKIVGHATDDERAHYLAMAEGEPRIEILKAVYYDEAARLFHDCSFLVLPSRSEAMGRVLIEAMSCGKAVIGANVGGIPEILHDGDNGFLFERENVESLADKLDKMIGNRNLRECMGKRSRELVETRLSSQKYAEKFCELLSERAP